MRLSISLGEFSSRSIVGVLVPGLFNPWPATNAMKPGLPLVLQDEDPSLRDRPDINNYEQYNTIPLFVWLPPLRRPVIMAISDFSWQGCSFMSLGIGCMVQGFPTPFPVQFRETVSYLHPPNKLKIPYLQ